MLNIDETLEFERIKEKLAEFAYTESAKRKMEQMVPFLSESEVISAQRETTEARKILDAMGNPPVTSFYETEEIMRIAEKGGCLSPEQLEKIEYSLTAVRRMKDFLSRSKMLEISLAYYEENLDALDSVREEISRTIRSGKVDDFASKTLKTVRNEIEEAENKMREKADAMLRSHKIAMSDSFCTFRNGHICLPVKKEYKLKIKGNVMDKSSSGNTLFIEPAAVSKYFEKLTVLKIEEENEVRRILYQLTAMLGDAAEIFNQNKRTIEKLDFIFAKGKLSAEIDGIQPSITMERKIAIKKGRHPLLARDICIPLDFQIGNGINGVIITGPNTGGKTVALKTVGLICLMAQCGLHVSCHEAELSMNNEILCDIGDGQNLSENLSTFSAHITNALEILKKAGKESLVIMDELGSGTDPMEGMGIAIAILEELKKSGAFYLITTHYPEVKHYAERTEGVLNARMTFDRESLKPLYSLEIGKAGESCAFYIAKKIGMPDYMLRRASQAAYGKIENEFSKMDDREELAKGHAPVIKRKKPNKGQNNTGIYHIGDSVMVYPDKKIGIVCREADEKGAVRVQIAGNKVTVNQKRLKLKVAAEELYPENYDFSILFDSVENRKKRHAMDKKYSPDIEITKRPEE